MGGTVLLSPEEALQRLQSGNRRFAEGHPTHRTHVTDRERLASLEGQEPFAVILACADSRVPPELVFDQGYGELFVVRTAGHAVTSVVAGSVEYAVDQLGTRLVLILGHSGCGAVDATLAQLQKPNAGISPSLQTVVSTVGPGVQQLLNAGTLQGSDLLEAAVRANVRAAVASLEGTSELVRTRQREGSVAVVGAEYHLATGTVEFLTEPG